MAVSTLCRYGVVGVYLLLPGAGKKWTAVQRLQYSVHVESQSQSEYIVALPSTLDTDGGALWLLLCAACLAIKF
jgi:hypothetical protein